MANKMVGVLAANDATHTLVVYGHDGLDELTTTDRSTVIESRVDPGGERHMRTYQVDPVSLGLERVAKAELLGGDAATNAELARRVLAGERGPRRDIVLLNAAAGLVVAGEAADLAEGLGIATAVVDDGRAEERLAQLVEVSQSRAKSAEPW
jgi:anthranilate phosphoribosyltransferase